VTSGPKDIKDEEVKPEMRTDPFHLIVKGDIGKDMCVLIYEIPNSDRSV
jgi:hypothetical protein